MASPGPTNALTPASGHTPMPSPTLVPKYPILEAAVTAMRNVESLRFVEKSKWSVTIVDSDRPDVEGIEAPGEYQSPDRLHKRAVVQYVHPTTTRDIQAIRIGNARYVTNPDTGEWERSNDSLWGADELFSNPIDFFESVVSWLGPNAYQGISTLGGVRVHRFVYSTPDFEQGGASIASFQAVIVVGVDDSLVKEVRTRSNWRQRPCPYDQKCLAIQIVPGWADRSVEFSYSDEAVVIQAPATDTPTPMPTAMAPSATPSATPAPTETVSPLPTSTSFPTPTPTPTPTSIPAPTLEAVEMAIGALSWVEDGMTVDEQEAVLQLRHLPSDRPIIAWGLVHKAWMQDDLSPSENHAVILLAIIAAVDGLSAEQVVEMPFLDTFERDDLVILETLSWLDQEGLRWLLSHPTLTGASAESQPAAMALLRLEWDQPEAAAMIIGLPWIGDGISPSEVNATLHLQELALESHEVFQVLVSTTWVQDGLDRDEITAVVALRGISGVSYARRDEAAALRIAAMPFLETVDGLDAAALSSLRSLFWESDEEDYLGHVLAHPTLGDGITDDEAIVVAALQIVAEERPDLLDTLLDIGLDAVEKRVIRLPLAGDVTLSVINLSPGIYSTMDRLERILLAQEEFMNVPFPRSYVGLLVADATSEGGGGGPSGLLTVDPQYAEDDYIIAHELAHTYWGFSPSWIAEGGADFMTTVSAGKQFTSHECDLGDTLSDLDLLYQELLESGQSTRILKSSGCAYSLGRGLFLDLHETLGDEAFRRGFGRLYLAMRDDARDEECTGLERGVCYVRAAFVADATPESGALGEPVIVRWYDGPRQ